MKKRKINQMGFEWCEGRENGKEQEKREQADREKSIQEVRHRNGDWKMIRDM